MSKTLTKEQKFDKIFEHVKIMNTEMGQLRDRMDKNDSNHEVMNLAIAKQGIDIEWLKKQSWLILGTIITTALGVAYSIIK
jgi:hypothetical protein